MRGARCVRLGSESVSESKSEIWLEMEMKMEVVVEVEHRGRTELAPKMPAWFSTQRSRQMCSAILDAPITAAAASRDEAVAASNPFVKSSLPNLRFQWWGYEDVPGTRSNSDMMNQTQIPKKNDDESSPLHGLTTSSSATAPGRE